MSEVAPTASTNRKTTIEILNQSKAKRSTIVPQINYAKIDLPKFVKMVQGHIKLSPTDPDYDVQRILCVMPNGVVEEISEENFPGEEFLNFEKISIKVYVTEVKVLTPAQQRRQRGANASAIAQSSLELNSILSPSSQKYISPAVQRASTPTSARAVTPNGQRQSPRPPSPTGGPRSHRKHKCATPSTPSGRSALALDRPRTWLSPGIHSKVPIALAAAGNKKESQAPPTVNEPTEHPVEIEVPSAPNLSEFSTSDNIGDFIASLCGQDNEAALEGTMDGIKETWKTRNSNGSITSSSDNDSFVLIEKTARDHSVASVASMTSAASKDSVARNLGAALLSVTGNKDEEDTALTTEKQFCEEALDIMPTQLSASAVSAAASHSAKKRSSVLKQTTASFSAEAGTALIDGKTTAQVVESWSSSLRKTGGGNFPTRQTPKKMPSKSFKTENNWRGREGSGGFGCSNVSPKMNRAMRKETRDTTDAEGRPSMATMTAQWEFMREQFLSSSHEQLEWLMESKQGGAYKYAHRKNEKAEDQYFKSIVDIEVLETKLKLLKSENGPLSAILQDLAGSYDVLFVNPNNDEEQQKVYHNQVALKNLVDTELKSIFSVDLEKELKALTENSDFPTVARKARKVYTTSLPEEIKKVAAKLAFANKINSESLKEMEKWSKREKETAEYERVMVEEDRQWMQENEEANMAALRQMRSLIPVDIAAITATELMERAEASGHLLSLELATEIKTNKLLHWIVMAPEDIAFDNFLNGEKRQFFANIEGLDVIEMRAVRMCLPPRFELDNEGQKAEWRERFVTRLKQLAGQENGDMVRGPWDFEAGKRSMVKLPPLKDEQARRNIYYFRTYDQSMLKLKQYDDRAALLKKKEGWLTAAEIAAAENKSQYDIILLELRDPNYKNTYGADVMMQAKELAKKAHQDADAKVKALKKDVQSLKSTISNATVSREEFVAAIEATKAYLSSQRDIDWEAESSPVIILGTFPENPEIHRVTVSESARFLSPEEEANKRRAEIEFLSLKKAPEERVSDTVLSAAVEDEDVDTMKCASTGEEHQLQAPGSEGRDSFVTVAVSSLDSRRRSLFDVPTASSLPTPLPRRRNSVLETANADMINKLNSMLSGNGPAPPAGAKQIKRASMISPAKAPKFATDTENVNNANMPPPAPVECKTKSTFLQNILSGGAAAAGGLPKPMGTQLSFLDQIKQKRGGFTQGTDESVPPPVSFLDAIKNRRIE